MKQITLKLYSFNGLDKEAKGKALTTHRDLDVNFDWWNDEFEDFIELCSYMGIAVIKDKIKFRGFYSQGDGSGFSAKLDILKLITAIENRSWKDYASYRNFHLLRPILTAGYCHYWQKTYYPTNRRLSAGHSITV